MKLFQGDVNFIYIQNCILKIYVEDIRCFSIVEYISVFHIKQKSQIGHSKNLKLVVAKISNWLLICGA